MPSVRKLSLHSSNILPKVGKDLTVFSTPAGESQYEVVIPDSMMEYTTALHSSDLGFLISEESDQTQSSSSSPPPPRKRQRLDHLSQEEKIMRRKLKNRVAAQSARDRKKARMTELEEQVVQLEAQRKYLLMENTELRNKNQKLEEQNAELRARLGLIPEGSISTEASSEGISSSSSAGSTAIAAASGGEEEGGSLESAALINAPQQKEQDLQLLTLWMMRYVYLPAIARLMTFLICFNSAVKNYSSVISATPSWKAQKAKSPNHLVNSKWWGPHQRAWNPSKN